MSDQQGSHGSFLGAGGFGLLVSGDQGGGGAKGTASMAFTKSMDDVMNPAHQIKARAVGVGDVESAPQGEYSGLAATAAGCDESSASSSGSAGSIHGDTEGAPRPSTGGKSVPTRPTVGGKSIDSIKRQLRPDAASLSCSSVQVEGSVSYYDSSDDESNGVVPPLPVGLLVNAQPAMTAAMQAPTSSSSKTPVKPLLKAPPITPFSTRQRKTPGGGPPDLAALSQLPSVISPPNGPKRAVGSKGAASRDPTAGKSATRVRAREGSEDDEGDEDDYDDDDEDDDDDDDNDRASSSSSAWSPSKRKRRRIAQLAKKQAEMQRKVAAAQAALSSVARTAPATKIGGGRPAEHDLEEGETRRPATQPDRLGSLAAKELRAQATKLKHQADRSKLSGERVLAVELYFRSSLLFMDAMAADEENGLVVDENQALLRSLALFLRSCAEFAERVARHNAGDYDKCLMVAILLYRGTAVCSAHAFNGQRVRSADPFRNVVLKGLSAVGKSVAPPLVLELEECVKWAHHLHVMNDMLSAVEAFSISLTKARSTSSAAAGVVEPMAGGGWMDTTFGQFAKYANRQWDRIKSFQRRQAPQSTAPTTKQHKKKAGGKSKPGRR